MTTTEKPIKQEEVKQELKQSKEHTSNDLQDKHRKIGDYDEAKRLAAETQLTAQEIEKRTGVALSTAYNYINQYRNEEIQNNNKTNKQEKVKPQKVENTSQITEAEGTIAMSLKLSMIDAPDKIGEVLRILALLGFEEVNIDLKTERPVVYRGGLR